MSAAVSEAGQSIAIEVLAELVGRAQGTRLTPLFWIVHPRAEVTAHVLYTAHAELRRQFQEWVDFLGAHRLEDGKTWDGYVTLRAVREYRGCRIQLLAELLGEPVGGEG